MQNILDRRRLLEASLFCCLAGVRDAMAAGRPELHLAIGQMRDAIDRQSSLKESDSNNSLPFTRFITIPHAIFYDDAQLKLTLPDCGARISMPTVLSFVRDKLDMCTASVLGDYVDVSTAAKKARELLSDLLRQGFSYLDSKYARLATIDAYEAPGVTAPPSLNNEDEIESLFLNGRYGVGTLIVCIVKSADLKVDFRMKNMRRAFNHGEDELRAQEDGLSDQQRSAEKAYYLEITILKELKFGKDI